MKQSYTRYSIPEASRVVQERGTGQYPGGGGAGAHCQSPVRSGQGHR